MERRTFLAACGCACWSAGALARVLPSNLSSAVGKGYEPLDTDERGLWHTCDRIEEALASSNLLVRDASLNAYIRGVTGRLLGEPAEDLRIYVMRNPDFNAGMWPNGMMLVQSGLMTRMRNEAQFASVLGHECGHYLRRHTLQRWRDVKTKTAIMSVMALAGAAASGATGNATWSDAADVLNNVLLLSLFQFSRAQESEADAYGLQLMHRSHYPLHAASEIWAQLIDERKASAAARRKTYRDRSGSVLSTHPPSADRMRDLRESAVVLAASTDADDRRDAWRAAIAPIRAMLLEEQIKLNDPGASLYLINSLSHDGWDGTLRYYEGEVFRLRDEPGDAHLAAESYSSAMGFADAPPEAHRAHGYAQLKAGNAEGGRRALTRYLEMKPDAVDAAMIRYTLAQ